MRLYSGITLLAFVMLLASNGGKLCLTDRQDVPRSRAFLLMFVLVFFTGLRSSFGDTAAYILGYRRIQPGLATAFLQLLDLTQEETLFSAYGTAMRTLFGTSFEPYLFGIAAVTGYLFYRTMFAYSGSYYTSFILFMLMDNWSWMQNGIRQFLAVAICFACLRFIDEDRPIPYLLVVLGVAVRIHTSAFVMAPMFFLVRGEPWERRTVCILVATVFAVMFSSRVLNLAGDVFSGSQYADEIASDSFRENGGSNVIRTLIFLIPPVLAFLNRFEMKEKAPKAIKVCVNMSVVCACLSAFANVTSGIYVGRMPIYFSVYNLILLPWMFTNIPVLKTGGWATLTLAFYLALYVYTNYRHAHPYYMSEFLHLYIR